MNDQFISRVAISKCCATCNNWRRAKSRQYHTLQPEGLGLCEGVRPAKQESAGYVFRGIASLMDDRGESALITDSAFFCSSYAPKTHFGPDE